MGRRAVAERLKRGVCNTPLRRARSWLAGMRARPDWENVLLLVAAALIGWALWDVGTMWVKVWAGVCVFGWALLSAWGPPAGRGPSTGSGRTET